jgi:hypothetical protein
MSEDYESEEDLYEEEEYIQNEVPPPDIDDEFREAILEAKRSLSTNIINGPDLGTRNAQDIKIVNNYIKALNNLYVLSLNAEKGFTVVNDSNLNKFPLESREKVKTALNFITDYFKKLSVVDKIPYTNYIRNSFKENQFILHNNFE